SNPFGGTHDIYGYPPCHHLFDLHPGPGGLLPRPRPRHLTTRREAPSLPKRLTLYAIATRSPTQEKKRPRSWKPSSLPALTRSSRRRAHSRTGFQQISTK